MTIETRTTQQRYMPTFTPESEPAEPMTAELRNAINDAVRLKKSITGAKTMTTETRTTQQHYMPTFTVADETFQPTTIDWSDATWFVPDGDGWSSCGESFLPAALAFDDMWAVPDGDGWACYSQADAVSPEPAVAQEEQSTEVLSLAVGGGVYRSSIAEDFVRTIVLVDAESCWGE
jgi:hypothetical protein